MNDETAFTNSDVHDAREATTIHVGTMLTIILSPEHKVVNNSKPQQRRLSYSQS